jgi:Domain of unknown function (DUF1929)/Legume lectin domain/Chitobiase/beta-hexosaminidase C-terminal domain/PKD domain
MKAMGRTLFVAGFVFLITLGLLAPFAPTAMSQANVQGQWQTLPYTMPINPIHTALLYNGKVLIVSGSGNYPPMTTYQWALWDPQAGTINVQTSVWDMFCNGMIVLPDGRPLVLGGTLQYDPFFGQPRTAIYDPLTNTLTDQQSMAHGRWYPTATVLGDGRAMVFAGTNETGSSNTAVEIYKLGVGWSPQYVAPWTPPLYPRLHLLPNGNVFYSGSTPTSSIFNPTTTTWTVGVAKTNYSGTRTYGSSVLFPLTPANGYKPEVIIMGGGNPATATTEIIDLSAATPAWVYGPNMSAPRIEMNATILPSGKILALGGSLNDEDGTTAALNADLYDPVANTFSPAGTEAYARLYHSVSLLMPDATVWVAGSNPTRGTYEPHMEIYSPAYLFNSDGSLATRPTITSVSTPVIGYGGAFTVTTPNAASISTVVLMRNGAVTHSFNMDQRYVGLSFTAGAGVLNVTAPPTGNVAPPGYYMLFLLNNAGVPSVSSMVQISTAPGDTPPTGTITSPASNLTLNAGQSTSYAGTGTSPDGTITGYSWNFEGGSPNTSSLANPGSVSYTSAGTFTTTFTVTDSFGLTDPNPPQRTITVPDFSLSVSPSIQSVAPGSSANYTYTVASAPGFVGNPAFTVSGLPSGATASFSPTSVSNSGSSVLTVSTGASTPAGVYTIAVTATSSPLSHVTIATLVVQSVGAAGINLGTGFSTAGMQFNGHTKLNGTRLQLTDSSAINEVASAFWTTPVNVQSFTNNFTFQLTNPNADGFTFTIQNVGPTAIGAFGGDLGYAGTPGITSSVAVKFDLHDNAGEGTNSTGLYTDAAVPEVPATALGGGVSLHSGDILQVQMTYDGTTLTMIITDTTTPTETFTTSWPINIPSTVGGNTAYVGFTGGTGGSTATQEILGWIFGTSGSSPAATPTFSPPAGTYSATQSVILSDTTSGASIFYTLDGSQPGTSVGGSTLKYNTPISVAATETINALATASGFSTSAVGSATYTIQTGAPVAINFTSGFTATGMQFNGHTKLNGTRLQLTDTTAGSEVASAFWTTPVNVQAFTNDFTFQLTNPNADGFTFTVQNIGPTAIGAPGGDLGYAGSPGITSSVAVKFDLHNNAGEGNNSTGLYTNGAVPTVPATTLGGGVSLESGDILQVQMTYNGTTLTMTITDASTPTETFTTSWPINIPATVGGNTAYAGFTAGTGGLTATQEILTWTYSSATASLVAATPTFSPVAGTYPGTQSVIISDTTSGASIFYTLDGSQPGTSVGGSTAQYTTVPISVASTETINALATAPAFSTSAVGSAAYTIQTGTPVAINFTSGFNAPGMQLNGHTKLNGTRLQLTDATGNNEDASAFWTTPVNIQAFTNNFTFQLTNPIADGFTFTMQNAGPTAIGTSGSDLGYAPGITPSVAVKFDFHNNAGEGNNSTGLYTNGAVPTVPATTLGGGVSLLSGDILQVQMAYNGTTLTMTITDTTTPTETFMTSWPINIPATVGGNTAYVGFTAGTGGSTATQEILNWTYSSAPASLVAARPTFSPVAGTYTGTQSVMLSDATSGASIFYTLDGSQPGTSVGGSTAQYTTMPISVASTETINALATAPGFSTSAVGSAAYTIQTGTPAAINFASGFSATGMQFNGHTKLNGTRLQLTDTTANNEDASAFWTTPVNIQAFTNIFTFQLTNPNADGFTFTVQNVGPTAIGISGSDLGYAGTPGITPSVAVKFDIHNNAGEGNNSTGLYTDGAVPTVPATMLGGGVNLLSGDILQVQMTYDGTTLTMTITDTTTPTETFTTSWPINIPATVGGNTAYVGFTAGTGGATATQEILNWTYTP